MSKKREYIFINAKGKGLVDPNSIYYVLSDVCKSDRFTAFDSLYPPINNYFLRQIRRIHTSEKLNRYIRLPLKNIWKKSLDYIEWDEKIEYYIIISSAALYTVNTIAPSYYMNLKKKHNIKYVLFMMEQWDSTNAKLTRQYYDSMEFDYVFTIYPQDKEKYGFIHTMNYYSKLFGNKDVNIEYDAYHSAKIEGREELIRGFIKKADENGVSYQMRLMDPNCEFADKGSNIIINKNLPYSEIVKETMKCNCIVEIIRNGLDAATNRYYEAICYNKKLLTNNKNVVNLPFYNPEWMHVFEKPDDIDWDWVKERITIDYHYDGCFSPVHIIEEIEREERGHKGIGKG